MDLRPLRLSDADALLAVLREPEVARWWGVWDARRVAKLLARQDVTLFAIEEAGKLVGLIQYSEQEEPDYRSANVDLCVHPARWGSGVGRQAIRVLARHLFNDKGHHRLTIDPAADNERAIRAFEGVGFRRVGVMRRYQRNVDRSGWHDGLLMDLLPEDLGPDEAR